VKITTRSSNGVVIIDLEGDLMPGFGRERLSETVADLLDEGNRSFLLNMSKAPRIDSSGVGALVRSFASIRKLNGQLKLVRPSSFVKRVFELTRLITVFDIFDDEASAISSF